MITDLDQITLDIDWFFTDGYEVAFVASAGGRLPKSVAKSKDQTDNLAFYFRNALQQSEAVVNSELNKIIPNWAINERYLSDFIDMTKRGLYSFDKTILNNFNDANYHLVTKPTRPLKIDELPLDIKDLLIKTTINGGIDNILNISQLF